MDKKIIRNKITSLFKESNPSDPYHAGPCPICGEFAKGTFRHIGAPVFCKNHHAWGGTCGHGGRCENTPLKELKGGLADGMSIKDIAKKHKVAPSTIRNQVDQGKDVEQEHTDDLKIATDIAKDHEVENPKYYDDLEKAGIDEENLKEMPYLDNTPDINGTPLDLQIEKWSSEEEFSQFLTKLFRGENYSDEKQPNIQMRNPRELLGILTYFTQDLDNPTTQFLIQFTRKFNSNGKNVTLKTINRKQINYWMAFIINAYNKAKK